MKNEEWLVPGAIDQWVRPDVFRQLYGSVAPAAKRDANHGRKYAASIRENPLHEDPTAEHYVVDSNPVRG